MFKFTKNFHTEHFTPSLAKPLLSAALLSSVVCLSCRVVVVGLGSSFAFLLTSHLFFNGVRECFAFLLGLCGCENANVLPNSVDFGCLYPFV